MLGVSLVKPLLPPSGGFSVEILTGVTLSWKTELNRSIPTMEDRIPRGLQYHHKMCCEKGSCHGRQACMFWRSHHCSDVVSGRVDLHMTRVRRDIQPNYQELGLWWSRNRV